MIGDLGRAICEALVAVYAKLEKACADIDDRVSVIARRSRTKDAFEIAEQITRLTNEKIAYINAKVIVDSALDKMLQTLEIRRVLESGESFKVATERVKKKKEKLFKVILDTYSTPTLAYTNSTFDGKLPNVFLADEVGALPNNSAIESMRSGQINILNKLGCIISTKYPTIDNPFESEVAYAKQVLDGIVEDDTVFALLYEPDEVKEWISDTNLNRYVAKKKSSGKVDEVVALINAVYLLQQDYFLNQGQSFELQGI